MPCNTHIRNKYLVHPNSVVCHDFYLIFIVKYTSCKYYNKYVKEETAFELGEDDKLQQHQQNLLNYALISFGNKQTSNRISDIFHNIFTLRRLSMFDEWKSETLRGMKPCNSTIAIYAGTFIKEIREEKLKAKSR